MFTQQFPPWQQLPGYGIRLGPEYLEPHNFRIDSSGWKELRDASGLRYLANPENDVTEVVEGPYAGEQHFDTGEAVVRELAKAGKTIPTAEQWNFLREFEEDWMLSGLPLAGLRANVGDACGFGYFGTYGCYWGITDGGKAANYVLLSQRRAYPAHNSARRFGFSVRCLKDGAGR